LGRPNSEAKSRDSPKFHCNDGNPRTHRADQLSRIVLFFLWLFDRVCHRFHHYLAALRCRTGRVLEVLQDADRSRQTPQTVDERLSKQVVCKTSPDNRQVFVEGLQTVVQSFLRILGQSRKL